MSGPTERSAYLGDVDNPVVVVWDPADGFLAMRSADGVWERTSVTVGTLAMLTPVVDASEVDTWLSAARTSLRQPEKQLQFPFRSPKPED